MSAEIQRARDVLAKWREGATAGPWKAISFGHGGNFIQVVQPWEHQPGADFDRFDNMDIDIADIRESKGDAILIVGTTSPDLLDAWDSMFEAVLRYSTIPNWAETSAWVEHTERIAAAIVAADERMSA